MINTMKVRSITSVSSMTYSLGNLGLATYPICSNKVERICNIGRKVSTDHYG